MRAMRSVCTWVVVGGLFFGGASVASAQDAQALRQDIDQLRREFEALKQQYGDRLTALEAKLAVTEGAAVPAAAPAPGQPPPTPPPAGAEGGTAPVYGASIGNAKVFNPDIAVIGDFLGAAGTNKVQPDPFGPGTHPNALQLHESEAAFQAVVDPYARADFFISFGEEGVSVEEGFITLTSLPGGLLTKVGKMRAAFGKVNSLHNHVLPWADRPLVIGNLVGGEDGINDAGISVARLIPNPWMFLEATGQVFRGDSGADPNGNPLFQTTRRSELSYVEPPARVPGHHRQREHRSRILVLARPQRAERRQSRGPWLAGHAALRHRRHVSLEAAAAVDLPLVRRPHRMDLEPSRSADRPSEWFGHVCLRRLSVRAPLVRWRPIRPQRPAGQCVGARHGRIVRHHLLAERVQPGSHAVPAHQLRAGSRRPTSCCFSSSSPSARTARIPSRVQGSRVLRVREVL